MSPVVLPRLSWQESPNQSARNLHRGSKPYLIVVHRPVGSYHGSVDWLCNPRSDASAHIVTEGTEATQLVAWDRKAWHAMAFNSVSYGIEVDDSAWDGKDMDAWRVAARAVAYLCHKTGIPAHQSRNPTHLPGIVRHFDLGAAGGGHSDPTVDNVAWGRFIVRVQYELKRGAFRKTWGKGRLARL